VSAVPGRVTSLHPRSRRRAHTGTRAALELLLEIAVPIGLLVAWALVSAGSDSLYFPPLTEILDTFADTWLFDRVGSDVVPSLLRLLGGYFLAIAVGVTVGIPLGLSVMARRAASPIIEFLRSIPPPALIPLGIVVIGVGDEMKVLIIAFVCVWFVLLNTIDGIAGIEPTMLDTIKVYRVRGVDKLRRVIIPAAAPQIFAGMRIALSVSLIMMVISEMVASKNGIGFFVLQSQRSFAIPEMWSGILLLGLLGYVLNLIFLLVERRALAWHRGARAGADG
jgi:ABC-type nitrate/sulfonate/bicarbonate transport system permease component